MDIMETVEITMFQTVSTCNATGIVYGHRLEIDGRCLTVACTFAAFLAFVFIETDFQPRETGEETENGSHGTDGIAIGATAPPCKITDNQQRGQGNDECGQVSYVLAINVF